MREALNGPAFGIFLVALAIALVIIIYNRISNKYHGVCPKCGKEFKATPSQLIFTVHAFNNFYLKCPHCRHVSMKHFEKDK